MEWFKIAVDLVTGIAWPFVVLVVAWLFRGELRRVLTSRNAHLKAGPFELAVEQARVDVETAAVEAGNDDFTTPIPLDMPSHPATDGIGIIVSAFARLEAELRAKLDRFGLLDENARRRSGTHLAAAASREGVIMEAAAEAVRGVAVLRNLVAHGNVG